MKKPTIYLAGAIRDGRVDDIEWREEAITRLSPFSTILNPLGGKSYNPETKLWNMSGIQSHARTIVKQDFWCVDRADIIVANLLALAEKYPNIGTLVEFGRATTTGAVIYSIVKEKYTGHENVTMYHLHPFIEENSSAIFFSVEACLGFLEQHLNMMSGLNPRFKGFTDANIPDRFSEEPGDSSDRKLHPILGV